MGIIQKINYKLLKKESNRLSIGDTASLQYESKSGFWRVRKFTGICMKKSYKGYNELYTLRNIVNGVPVELSFYSRWNLIVSLQKLGVKKIKGARKGSLTFLRGKPLNYSKVRV